MSIWDQLAAATADLSIASFLHRDQKQNRPLDDAVPFTVGMIALAAKMAKADGVITKDEVFAFKKAFKVSDLEMKQAAHVFNLAKQDVGGYEACAEELVTVFKGDRKMLE
jgi:DnaJ like chaperone protein